MIIVLLGPPGAGKGTQADLLSAKLGIPKIATGDVLRAALRDGTKRGLEAKAYMDRGELVPDNIVVDVVEERFSNPSEVEYGFVLDGFPRTENQAEELDRILGTDYPLNLVVDLDVPTDMAIERLLGRGREDDTRESIRRRLELYEQETQAADRPLRQA